MKTRSNPIDFTQELATLRRLQQQVEVAIGCIEGGLMRKHDDRNHYSNIHDFRVGDFVVTDLQKWSYETTR